MFITNASYECVFPNILGEAPVRYFRAFDLSTRQPWFLVTFRMVERRVPFVHTVACASDLDLVLLLQSSTWELASLQQIVANRDGVLAWRIRDVVRVWRSPDPVGGETTVRLEYDDDKAAGSPMTDQAAVEWVLIATVTAAPQPRNP